MRRRWLTARWGISSDLRSIWRETPSVGYRILSPRLATAIKDEARPIAANIAKLPEVVQWDCHR
jgi:hypothetical protein